MTSFYILSHARGFGSQPHAFAQAPRLMENSEPNAARVYKQQDYFPDLTT